VTVRAAKGKVDWETKTQEMTAERVLENCLEAIADGDSNALEACLLELGGDEREDAISNLLLQEKVRDDELWQKKLTELSAERALENCMEAVMGGDPDELEACIADAENDSLLPDVKVVAEEKKPAAKPARGKGKKKAPTKPAADNTTKAEEGTTDAAAEKEPSLLDEFQKFGDVKGVEKTSDDALVFKF